MNRPVRRRLLVDPKIQGTLVVRIVLYWGYCLLAVALLSACWITSTQSPVSGTELTHRLMSMLWPALAATMLALPIVIIDLLRVSNRFVGPAFRLKREMQRLADGEPVQPIKFRGDDFWTEFAEQFNRLVAQRAENANVESLASATEDSSTYPVPATTDSPPASGLLRV